MKSILLASALAVGLSISGWSQGANATLINDTISIQGVANQSGLLVSDPGVEYDQTIGSLRELIDVSASSFSLTYINLSASSPVFTNVAYTLSELDWFDDPLNGVISNVTLISQATQNGVTISNLNFIDGPGLNSGSITFNSSATFLDAGATTMWEFQISATHSVPEPATLAIFVIGLAGLGLMRRRKRAA